ncbi:MAG: hypothetical protein OYL92_05000 [Acidobacteriota bacterium]|nr:hypothetical protein [Acidobacteriota bacterium]MDE3264312.1 hypothetical protein [Acidobacteriota bacterium]
MIAGLALGCLAAASSAAEPGDAEAQLAAAIQAAPDDRRDGARVLGWTADGKVVELRAGSNDLVCLAAQPDAAQWSVACYHESLEPFMARGRELTAQGIEGQERIDIREREIAEGKLAMPREPRTLYVLHGSGFDAATGEVNDAYLRWVIYTPYATPESTGLTTRPVPGAPWLMFPGTAGAHIMINPPRPDANAR